MEEDHPLDLEEVEEDLLEMKGRKSKNEDQLSLNHTITRYHHLIVGYV